MLKTAPLFVFIIAATLTLAYAATTDLSHHDKKFMEEAASGGMMEVQLGNYAATHASSDAVKNFGQRMVTDHTQVNNQLKTVAQNKNFTLPTQMNHKNQSDFDKLTKLSGADFDRQYITHMIHDHHKDIKEFQKEADKGSDPDVKAFASNTLPILQQHLQLAHDTAKQIGVTASAK
jgi:putative membrane protein